MKYISEDTKNNNSSDQSTDQEESGYLSGYLDDATETERDSEDVSSSDNDTAEQEQTVDEYLCLINNNVSAIKKPRDDIKDLFDAEDSVIDHDDDDCRGSNSSMICQVKYLGDYFAFIEAIL